MDCKTKANVRRRSKFNLTNLKMSLKYRQDILKFIIKLKERVQKKNRIISKLKKDIAKLVSLKIHTYIHSQVHFSQG